MQVPLLSGVYADSSANFDASYPINLEPVITDTGLSQGYLRTAPGLTLLNTGPGADRGAIAWNNFGYRVMGNQLIRLSGAGITNLGVIPDTDLVSMDYSFDLLAIVAGGGLFYWDGTSVNTVTDPDLGVPIDVVWIDGYFMMTDGTSLIVTDLSDPYSINPLKYGSAEADPDPILAIRKVRNEVYAINQYTIEDFQNVGGSGFPFRRNPGGMIPKGACGRRSVAYFGDTIAFVGSGRDEEPSVYIAGYGDAVCISTPQIDAEIAAVPWEDRQYIEVETITRRNEQLFLVHLPDKTLVYSHQATLLNKAPVWHVLASGSMADDAYPGRHFTYAEGRWVCGTEDAKIGYLDDTVETHFDDVAGWQFDTVLLYNKGRGGILKVSELTGLPGRSPPATTPTAAMSWTQDGQDWSQERFISTGAEGERLKRIQWRPKTRFANYMGLRFRGANTALQSFARLDVEIEPLNV